VVNCGYTNSSSLPLQLCHCEVFSLVKIQRQVKVCKMRVCVLGVCVHDGTRTSLRLKGVNALFYPDSSVGIATVWTPGVRFPAGARFFCTSQRPDWFRGPPSLLSNGYRGLFPPEVKRPELEADTTYLHLVPRSSMVELYLHSPIRLHGVMLH
jgi:hypothetical protein